MAVETEGGKKEVSVWETFQEQVKLLEKLLTAQRRELMEEQEHEQVKMKKTDRWDWKNENSDAISIYCAYDYV